MATRLDVLEQKVDSILSIFGVNGHGTEEALEDAKETWNNLKVVARRQAKHVEVRSAYHAVGHDIAFRLRFMVPGIRFLKFAVPLLLGALIGALTWSTVYHYAPLFWNHLP